MDRGPGRADGAGPDLPLLPDGRLPPREAPAGRAAGRLQRPPARRRSSGGSRPSQVAAGRRGPGARSRARRPASRSRPPGRTTLNALTDLRNQIGIPETAGTAEPLGEFILPGEHPAGRRAGADPDGAGQPPRHPRRAGRRSPGPHAAVHLAKGDRIPTPIVGPQYAMDEAGVQYIGLVYITPIPILNSGKPLVRPARGRAPPRRSWPSSRSQQRAVTQVRAAVAKWNGATAWSTTRPA